MFGRGWEKARGTVVDRRVIKHNGAGRGIESEYVVDVLTAGGELFRTKVGVPTIATDFRSPATGAQVGVEFNPKNRKVRCDKDDPALSMKALKQQLGSSFDASLSAPAGSTPSPIAAASAQLNQVQALLQTSNDPNDPRSAALRGAIERANGVQP